MTFNSARDPLNPVDPALTDRPASRAGRHSRLPLILSAIAAVALIATFYPRTISTRKNDTTNAGTSMVQPLTPSPSTAHVTPP